MTYKEVDPPPIGEEAILREFMGFNVKWYKFFEAICRKVNNRTTGWTAATGISDTGPYAVYTGTAISNPPTQAQVQAIDAELVKQSKRMVALEEALRTAEVID
jgi:hypothetical protein